MLGNVRRGAAVLAAEGEALQEAEEDEERRSKPADRFEGRKEADEGRRAAHDRDRHEERVLTADEVADPPEDEGAERTDEESRRVRDERREEGGRGVAFGEEESREERGQRGVQVKVVPLEDRADRRRDDDAPFLGWCDDPFAGCRGSRSTHRFPPSCGLSAV